MKQKTSGNLDNNCLNKPGIKSNLVYIGNISTWSFLMPYLCDFLCLCSLDGNACFVVKCQGAVKLKRYVIEFLFQQIVQTILIGGFSLL